MKKNLSFLLLCLTLASGQLKAHGLPENKEQFCARFQTSQTDRETIQDLSVDSINLISFKNNGGLFNGGVCWWHSRFQRNALYLGIFKPEQTRPKTSELKKIIHQLRLGNAVVTIPGFANFSEFTAHNESLIQTELNDWQIYDGVILGSWIDGLKGNTTVESSVLSMMMAKLYDYVAIKKKIAYQKLQIKGITSHAWLVTAMKPMPSGMDIGFIDSNNPRMSEIYSYKTGDTSFFVKGYGNFVPYLEFTREEIRLLDTGKVFCGIKVFRDDKLDRKNDDLDLEEPSTIR